MAEETYGFEQARVRLEEIASQVKRKDTSLEQSLDLLEEGVRLANMCTEQIDHTQWRAAVEVADAGESETDAAAATGDGSESEGATDVPEEAAAAEPDADDEAATDGAGPDDGEPGDESGLPDDEPADEPEDGA